MNSRASLTQTQTCFFRGQGEREGKSFRDERWHPNKKKSFLSWFFCFVCVRAFSGCEFFINLGFSPFVFIFFLPSGIPHLFFFFEFKKIKRATKKKKKWQNRWIGKHELFIIILFLVGQELETHTQLIYFF